MLLLKHFSIEDFKDTFPLASFGARICYSDKDIHHLLTNDKRIIDKQKRAEFLFELAKNKHFSVFSHSFVYKKVGEEDALKIGATYFKSHYNPKYPDVVGISLRHYLEELQKLDQEQFNNVFKKLAEYNTRVKILDYASDSFSEPIDDLSEITCDYFPEVCDIVRRFIGVHLLYLNTDYDGYAVFYIDGISRIATHQLVRHSALNFSQRSQRYVKEDDNYTVIPDNILSNSEAIERVKLHDKLLKFLYKDLVYNHKVKREDARYFLPAGARTSIVVSGTLNWINDFIEKRLDSHAQWEIRHVARLMKYLLDKQIGD